MTEPPVAEGHPPDLMLKVLNPIMKGLVRAGAMKQLAILRFNGRKSGRRYDLVVGWHEVDDGRVVFTPARWAVNFRGGIPVSVRSGRRTLTGTGTLVDDPAEVAPALQQALEQAKHPREIGLKVREGHRITPDDVRAVGRRMIRLSLG